MEQKQKARDNAARRIVDLDAQAQQAEQFDLVAHLVAGGQVIVDLEHLLESDPAEGRRVLRTLLVGAITVTPVETADGVAFDYRGQGRLDPVLPGRIGGDGKNLSTTELVTGR